MPPPISRQEFLASLEELTCPICQESFEGKSEGTHYPVEIEGCRHVYGADCLETWVTTNCSSHDTCPTCRAVLFGDPDEESSDEEYPYEEYPHEGYTYADYLDDDSEVEHDFPRDDRGHAGLV
jgi:hypothetical protein